jgi:hypothetical protein
VKGESELVRTPPHRVRKLNSLRGVREEMVSVYRASRKGEMKTEEMTRFIFALRCIAQVIEQSDLETRMDKLERSLEAEEERNGSASSSPTTH